MCRVLNYCQNTHGIHLKWHLEEQQVTFTKHIPEREKKRVLNLIFDRQISGSKAITTLEFLDKRWIDIKTDICIRLVDYIRIHKRRKSSNTS